MDRRPHLGTDQSCLPSQRSSDRSGTAAGRCQAIRVQRLLLLREPACWVMTQDLEFCCKPLLDTPELFLQQRSNGNVEQQGLGGTRLPGMWGSFHDYWSSHLV